MSRIEDQVNLLGAVSVPMLGERIERDTMLQVKTEHSGEVKVVHCEGRLVRGDEASALREAVTSRGRQHLVLLDLAGVNSMDAGGLGTLVALHTWACKHGIELKLVNVRERVQKLLHMTGLDAVLQTRWTEYKQALEAWC
jgi:anti-sigma B factor antagonist